MIHLFVQKDRARPANKKSTAVHYAKFESNTVLQDEAMSNRSLLLLLWVPNVEGLEQFSTGRRRFHVTDVLDIHSLNRPH